jgi:heme-degrading monooxygenase HmoA
MISRQWCGIAKRERAVAYQAHLQGETFPAIRRIEGFIDATIHKRAVPIGIEFLVVTRWTSLDAIRRFAGDDVEAAVVPKNAQEMMLKFDARVRHYEIVEL